jgi:4-amino-4-deoxy-L-arabinose transferase-like glycosyltransferase
MSGFTHSSLWPERLSDRLLLAIVLLLPLFALGVPPLFDLDEGAFTASTVEMFLRGDFLSSYLLGEPRHDKPILIYWLQALSVSLLGTSEFAFRLPSAISASLWVLVTYAFVARTVSREAALSAALILVTAIGLVVITRAAIADALLNLWLASAGYAAWLWLKEDQPRWRYLSFAAMALGFLAKGPVAVLIPVGAVLLWCLSRMEFRRFFNWALDWKAILLFLAIAAPWFVIQTILEGPGFLTGFFLKHNLSRFDAPMEGHGGNYFFYVPVVLITLLPHTGLLLAALGRLKSLWKDELVRFGLIWFGLVLALFSFSGTKLPHYVFYGYGGLVLVLAHMAVRPRNRWLVLLPGVALFALLLALPDLLGSQLPNMRLNPDDSALLTDVQAAFGPGYRMGLVLALLTSLVLLFWRRVDCRTALHVNGLLAAVVVAGLLLPAVGEVQQAPIKHAGQMARDLPGPLVMYGVNTPSFQTYAGRQVNRRLPLAGDLVLTRESRLAELPNSDVLFRERSYVLTRMK